MVYKINNGGIKMSQEKINPKNEITDRICKECSKVFKGEGWRTHCVDCFKKQKAKTTQPTQQTKLHVEMITEANLSDLKTKLNEYLSSLECKGTPKTFFLPRASMTDKYTVVISYEK